MSQVSNGHGAGDRIAGTGQLETKTQNAADLKTLVSLNKGASLTQVRESPLSFRKDAILAKPDLRVKRDSRMFPLFVHVGLTGLAGPLSSKKRPSCPAIAFVPSSSHEAGHAARTDATARRGCSRTVRPADGQTADHRSGDWRQHLPRGDRCVASVGLWNLGVDDAPPGSPVFGVDTALGGNVQSTDTRTVLQREVADVHVEHTTTDDDKTARW